MRRLVFFVTVLLVLFKSNEAGGQTLLYASPNGVSTTCAETAPCSLTQARDKVRSINGQMTADIVVVLRSGIYSLTSPLQFTSQDSGSNGYKVTYKAAPGETPVLSGGTSVAGWSLFDAKHNIFRSYVGQVSARQFFVNNARAVRARGVTNPPGFMPIDGGFSSTTDMSQWINQDDIEIVSFNEWKSFRCGIASIQPTSILLKEPCWRNSQLDPGRPMHLPTWIENAFELLDAEGEWYLNQKTGFLYYKPRAGEDMMSATAILPRTECLLNISGSLSAPVHDLQFEGLNFAYTTWLRPSSNEGFAEVQANYALVGETAHFDDVSSWSPPAAAVAVTMANSIRFERNTFVHLGGAGITLDTGSQQSVIERNLLYDISAGGMRIGGITVDDHHPSDPRMIVSNNTVSGNYIHDIGIEYQGAVGIFVGYTDGTSVLNNELANLPYTGISIGWGWGWTDAGGYDGYSTPTTSRNNTIAYNLIHDHMRLMRDGGGIYTLGAQPNSTIHHNFIYGQSNEFAAIYLDEGSQGFSIYSNVINNAPHWLFFHLAQHNQAQSNYTDAPEMPDGGGVDNTEAGNIMVADNGWPPAAQLIMSEAGLENPVLLSDSDNRAIALDAVTFQAGPFSLTNPYNFSPDHRTRILIFTRKTSGQEVISAQGEDTQGNIFSLPIESKNTVPAYDWLTQLTVRLPDGLSGDVWLSVTFRGLTSNKARIRIV